MYLNTLERTVMLTAAPSSSCSLETIARRSRSIRFDSWSPRRRALSSALSLLSCRFLLLRSRTSSRYLEFCRHRGGGGGGETLNALSFCPPHTGQRISTVSHLFVQPLLFFSAPPVFPLHLLHSPPDRSSFIQFRSVCIYMTAE